jgi:ATP-dependent protease ClpP protease subunit
VRTIEPLSVKIWFTTTRTLMSDKARTSDDLIFGLGSGSKSFYKRPIATAYEFYLSGPVTEANDYTEWFDIMRNATPDDDLNIRINSRGGDVATAIQFIRVMAECLGQITCSIEGDCMSAATMIFLAGDRFEITPHSLFMVHNYSGGTIGKGGEMFDQIVFERDWSAKLLKQVYTGFLTKKEIKSLLDGKDIWLDYEEVAKRVSELAVARKTAKPQ